MSDQRESMSGVNLEAQSESSKPAPVSNLVDPGLMYFQGRIGRAAFWLRLAPASVLYVVVLLVNVSVLGDGAVAGLVTVIATLLWAAVTLATSVKRWHDLDRPGLMVLLCLTIVFVPVALVWQGFVKGSQGPNRFGAEPS